MANNAASRPTIECPWDRDFPRMFDVDGPRWPLDVHGRSGLDPFFMNFPSIVHFRDSLFSRHFVYDPNFLTFDDFFHDIFLQIRDGLINQDRFAYVGNMFKFPLKNNMTFPNGLVDPHEFDVPPGALHTIFVDSLPIYFIKGHKAILSNAWHINIKKLCRTDQWNVDDRHTWREEIWNSVMNDGRDAYEFLPLGPVVPTLEDEPYARPARRPAYEDRNRFFCGGDYWLSCWSHGDWSGDRTLPLEVRDPSIALEYEYFAVLYERALQYFDKINPERCPVLEGVANKITLTEADRDKDDGTMPQCPICFQEFSEMLQLKHCGHRFCPRCIGTWTIVGDYCPMDRISFRPLLNPDNGVSDVQEFPHGFQTQYRTVDWSQVSSAFGGSAP